MSRNALHCNAILLLILIKSIAHNVIETKFPKLIPPKDASVQAQKGFLAFRKNCMTCHSINGDGGKKSVDLNYPRSVTEYIDNKKLFNWIADPVKVKPDTTMPALNRDLKNRHQVVLNIISYLRAMKK